MRHNTAVKDKNSSGRFILERACGSDAPYPKMCNQPWAVAHMSVNRSAFVDATGAPSESLHRKWLKTVTHWSDGSPSQKTLNPPRRCYGAASEIARETAAARRSAKRHKGAWHLRRFTAPNSDKSRAGVQRPTPTVGTSTHRNRFMMPQSAGGKSNINWVEAFCRRRGQLSVVANAALRRLRLALGHRFLVL